jgi:predicted AAA+ superfamily ATPase
MIDSSLLAYQNEQLRRVPTVFHRYMYHRLPWESRMVGLVGPRGIGKSTLLLQHIAESADRQQRLYVSADSIYFATHSLIDLTDDFVKYGGVHLYIDEVHKYKNWSRELKQIYDTHPSLKVTFTGSSILDIIDGEADLSRRAVMYSMQGLSFREYLALFHQIDTPVYPLEQILANKAYISKVEHPLPLFKQYLQEGYYPFSNEPDFPLRLEQIVRQTIESDIAQYADLKASTARKLIQLLGVISAIAPMKPNADSLSQEIGVSKNNIPDYLVYLEKAGMIGLLRDTTQGLRGLGKVEKVYIDNHNLMTMLAYGTPNIGNLRETFFYNQMRVYNKVLASRMSDFTISDYTFEVGGKKKGNKQIADIANGFVVKDDIEYGFANTIPLWAFGLNY